MMKLDNEVSIYRCYILIPDTHNLMPDSSEALPTQSDNWEALWAFCRPRTDYVNAFS